MILFKKDILTNKCIIDTKTKNVSFLKMSMVLKKLGVKNNLFMLVLCDETLQGIDPHSTTLTENQQLRVAYEAKINPWYFFREVIRIPSQGGEPVRYKLNRANLALIWLYLNNVDTYLTMPRQIGKTVGVISITSYFMYVLGRNSNVAMFAKDADLRTENVRRLKDSKEGLPPYMVQEGSAYNTNNQETVEYKPHNTKYITFVAHSDKKRAAKQGRGESFVWSHWDELAFYINNKLSYPSAIAASETVGELARDQGLPCATLITTTAGFTSTAEGKYAHSFKSQALRFSEKLYDTEDNESLKEIVENSSGNNFVYVEYSYKQLGKDEKWFKNVTRNKPPEVICIDYLNKWVHGSGESIISKRLIDLLEKNIEEPVSITIDNGIVMRWFAEQTDLDSPMIKNIPFILSSDTSDNIGKDFTTLVLTNPKDMAVVMTCRCNQSNMVLVANAIFNLMRRFPNSVFIPERNRAATLIDVIVHMITTKTDWDPFKRIFNYYFQDKHDTVNVRSLDIELGSVRKMFGFKTTGAENSRKFIYSKVLNTTIERNYMRIFDKTIVDEICDLVVRDGRIDHSMSGNDDTLIAYLIGCWFIMYGKHVYLYGIDTNDILSVKDDEDAEAAENTGAIKNRIVYLQDKLSSGEVSEFMRHAFESELKELKTLIPEDDGLSSDVVSMAQVDKVKSVEYRTLDTGGLSNKLECLFN